MISHQYHIEKVLQTIPKAGHRLKPDKCSFGITSAEVLGFTVDGGEVKMLLDEVESICAWPVPVTPNQMRSLVGLARVHRKLIPLFSLIALPLLDLVPRTNHEYRYKLSNAGVQEQVEKAMMIIKKTIMRTPALALPEKGNLEFLVQTDASGFAIGATLRQKQ